MRSTETSHAASRSKDRVPRLLCRGDLAASLVGMALGLGVCIRSVGLTVGTPVAPQPGFFPLLGGVLLASLSLLLLLQTVRQDNRSNREQWESRLARPALLIGGLGIYAWLLERLGYPLMTTLIALLVLRVLETRWVLAVVVSVLLALGSFALFVKLGVPLPTGQVFGG